MTADLPALHFSSMRVIVDVNAVKDGDPYPVKLSWRERLCLTSYRDWLKKPFQPWVKVRMVTPKVPAYFIVKGGILIAHPAVLEQLKQIERAAKVIDRGFINYGYYS